MEITEFEELSPTRVDAVGTPANGIGFLMLKSIDPEDLVKSFVDGLCGVSRCEVCHDRYTAVKETDQGIEKAKMRAKERHALDASDFAFPDQRKEPLNDAAHVRNAMSRFSEVQGVSAEDRKKAARRIIARAKALGIDVSEDSDVARAAKQTAPDKSVPEDEAESQTDEEIGGPEGPEGDPEPEDGGEPTHQGLGSVKPPLANGQGDTAPDKSVPMTEALSQTRAEKDAPPEDATGDKAPDGDAEAARAKTEAETQTDEVEKNDANTPGSPEWEHKDVALGEKAEALVAQLADVVRTFTEREKAEGGATKQARRILAGVEHVSGKPALLKELAEMTTTELLKALDELGAARRDAEKAAKKAAKREAKKDAKAAEKAAKAADEPAADLAKAIERAEAAEKAANEAKEIAEKIAAQDGRRPFVNGAGVAAALRTSETRESAFKAFEDHVARAEADLAKAKAADEPYAVAVAKQELGQARHQLTAMKMIAAENARERDPQMTARALRGQGVPLISNRHQLPDDTSLKAL